MCLSGATKMKFFVVPSFKFAKLKNWQAIGFMKAGAEYQKQKNPELWKKIASLCIVRSVYLFF